MSGSVGTEQGGQYPPKSWLNVVSWRYYGMFESAAGYWLGIMLGIVIGLIDVFLPATYHNLLYYFLIYSSLGILSGCFAAITAYRLFLIRSLGIASISMGFWAIAWSVCYYALYYPEWHKTFVSDQLIGIGLGISVPITTYLFSTFVQSAGGATLIFLTNPSVFNRITGWAKERFVGRR